MKNTQRIVSIKNTTINTIIFKYLGFNIKYDEPSTGDSSLEKRNAWFMCLRKKWRTSKSCSLHAWKSWTPSCIVEEKRQADHANAVYVSALRKTVKGGYRWKAGTFLYELLNKDILRRCNTENKHQFIARQQHHFIEQLIFQNEKKYTRYI